MNDQLSDLLSHTIMVGATAAAPFLLVLLAVGLFMGVLQAATQVNEQALPFLFKMIALGIAIMVAGPWAVHSLKDNLQTNIRAISSHGRAPGASDSKKTTAPAAPIANASLPASTH